MRDGVDLAHMSEELVAEPLAARRAAHEPRDVDEGQPRRLDLGRLGELREAFRAVVRRDLLPTSGSMVLNG